jgi:hypothetical protein
LGIGYGGAALPGIEEEETDSATFGMLKNSFSCFLFQLIYFAPGPAPLLEVKSGAPISIESEGWCGWKGGVSSRLFYAAKNNRLETILRCKEKSRIF